MSMAVDGDENYKSLLPSAKVYTRCMAQWCGNSVNNNDNDYNTTTGSTSLLFSRCEHKEAVSPSVQTVPAYKPFT